MYIPPKSSTFALLNRYYMAQKQTIQFEIAYQEVDMNNRLRLYTLEEHLLNTAGKVADSLGFGTQALRPYNCAWIITRMMLEMDYMPTQGEHICIETWIEQNAHMLSTRNYRIYLHTATEDRLIGRAKSVWAILDINKREIVNMFDHPMFAGAVDGEVLDITRSPRMLPVTEPDVEGTHTVRYSDVDYNRHCNSCKYLQIMMDTCLPSFLSEGVADSGKQVIRLDINYQKEVYLGDTVTVLCKQSENDIQYTIKTETGQASCSAKITKL